MKPMDNGDLTTFWIVCTGLAAVVALLLALALRAPRRGGSEPAAAFDLRVYRDQLKEVDNDLARGVVDPADADRVRAEISRRILAADAALQDDAVDADARKGAPLLMTTMLFALLVGGSLWFYAGAPFWLRSFGFTEQEIETTRQALEADVSAGGVTFRIDVFPEGLGAPGYGDLSLQDRIALAEEIRKARPNQQTVENSLPAYEAPNDISPDYAALVNRLRDTVAERPNDLQGLILLTQNEANLGNFRAAARAQRQVVALKATEATAQDYVDYADMLVLAAGGFVSPEAEAALSQALSRDPTNGTARYYIGLMMKQTGRPDRGFRLWDQLLREGPEDAPWIEPILAQIEDLALRAGVNYQRPEIGQGQRAPRGPSAEDIEAAGSMSPSERIEMIQSMVQGLSDRLATEGGPVEDWAQLITALGVLAETASARAVYENAVQVFADDTRALDLLLRAGQRAQVAE